MAFEERSVACTTGVAPSGSDDVVEPPGKIARTSAPRSVPDSSGDTAATLSLDEWMKSWKPGRGQTSSKSKESVAEMTEDEAAAALEREEEARKAHLLDEAVESLRIDLSPLVEAAMALAMKAQGMVKLLQKYANAKMDEKVLRRVSEFVELRADAQTLMSACKDYLEGKKYQRLQQGATDSVKKDAEELVQKFKVAERFLLMADGRAMAAQKQAKEHTELVARRAMALKAGDEQGRLFSTYDKDGDSLLNASEIQAFARGECNFDLPSEKVSSILQSEPFKSTGGVSRSEFSHLRLLIGVASVADALGGVEVEVAKAELKARPLSAKGPAAFPIERLQEPTEELDVALDGAKDYLAAAREQFQGAIDGHDSQGVEVASLGKRIDNLEERLRRVIDVFKHCQGRLELQRKKDELMRDVSGMQHMPRRR